MIPYPFDVIFASALFSLCAMLFRYGETTQPRSWTYRSAAFLFSIVFLALLVSVLIHVGVIIVSLFLADTEIISFVFTVVIAAILYRLTLMYPEWFPFTETMNFMLDALRFRNHFRVRDAATREMIGTHRMKEIYREVHGREFDGKEFEPQFNERMSPVRSSSSGQMESRRIPLPPEYEEQRRSLEAGQRTDVSVAFRFELLSVGTHPFTPFMEEFIIDPADRCLQIGLFFPFERPQELTHPSQRRRMTGDVYESLQHLIPLPWFRLYARYIGTILLQCHQREFADGVTASVRPLMELRIPLATLRENSDRITPYERIITMASVTFLP